MSFAGLSRLGSRGGVKAAASLALACCAVLSSLASAQPLVNFESPHVHPLALSPDGTTLAACNTLDNRVELFDVSTGTPEWTASVPVGYDPVSVRFRTNSELWVVNHISDSVNIVSLATMSVIHTISTLDEPCDVVFAGNPQRAFVSCSQVNTIEIFNPADLSAAPSAVVLDAEDPRALAVSPDGFTVYAAIFESGNKSTVLMGSSLEDGTIDFPPNIVGKSGTPHGTQNPAFNGTGAFIPPKANNGTPPRVSLIVKQDANGAWRDDTGADWTRWVSGDQAFRSGRPQGWTLLDHDIAVIDTATLSVDYIDGLMNLNMGIAVNPANGKVATVGSDGINEIRFEPNVNGIFTRVMLGIGNPDTLEADVIVDLNGEHLDYSTHTVPPSLRVKSIGDPRAIVWTPDGSLAYVAGMGSNNVIVIDGAGARSGLSDTIDVGEGPTGLALDPVAERLYVLNRFEGSVSAVNTAGENVLATTSFFDPTPAEIKLGRRHLFDTHATSGLGQAACASCHVDARMDRLAWDLGEPGGAVKNLNGLNLGANVPQLNSGFQPFHPMKGPMTTQTLQDIIGHEPFHWRGDRLGIEEFNGAFPGLLGKDSPLTQQEMAEFKAYLATIYFPPNPFRNLDNTLPTNLSLEGHYRPGRFGNGGQPLPNGNAQAGMELYRSTNRLLDAGALACVTCHTLPTGMGTDRTLNGLNLVPIPRDPVTNNNHLMLVSIDGSTNITLKVPQLRNLYDKVGMSFATTTSRAGFGFTPDGAVDSIEHFVSEGIFDVQNDQEVADLTAFLLAFSGSDLPAGSGLFQPPGTPSKDAHAAVGKQVTLNSSSADTTYLNQLITIDANSTRIEAIAHVRENGVVRGYRRLESGNWQSDAQAQQITLAQLIAKAQGTTSAVTVTIVPQGSGLRLALDRDGDGSFNFDEVLNCTDPNDPASFGAGECEGEGVQEGGIEGTLEGEGTNEGMVEGSSEGEGGAEGEGAFEGEGEPVGGVDFCAIQDEIAGLVSDPQIGPILFDLLGTDVLALALLACDVADLNGPLPSSPGSSLQSQLPDPNGILDGGYELAVLAELINRPGRYGCLDDRGGVDSHAVGPAFEANTATALGSLYGVAQSDLEALFRLLIGNDLDGVVEGEDAQEVVISRLAQLIPNIGVLLAGYATLGDDDSIGLTTLVLGFIEDAIIDAVGFGLGLGIDPHAYQRLNAILSINGDLDGDGLTQLEEHAALGGSLSPSAYLYAVLHTNASVGGYEPDCAVEPEGEGEGTAEGFVEGSMEGVVEGSTEGFVEGVIEGIAEGGFEGVEEGVVEGGLEGEGQPEGLIEGTVEGIAEGMVEGVTEGVFEGGDEGEAPCVFTVTIVGCINCSVYVDESFSVSDGFSFEAPCGSNHCYQPSTDPEGRYVFTSWGVNGGGISDFTLCTDQTSIVAYYTPIIVEGAVDGEGAAEGMAEGAVEGSVEGVAEGAPEGVTEGVSEGSVEGLTEGAAEGVVEGVTEGASEGQAEGSVEGASEGAEEGEGEEGEIDLGEPHSADLNRDHRINLAELLRIIQFYNAGRFGCDSSTEDGYAPGSTQVRCPSHSGDYNPFDWRINLSELLRVIQLFHSPRYRNCGFDGSEDQFCIVK